MHNILAAPRSLPRRLFPKLSERHKWRSASSDGKRARHLSRSEISLPRATFLSKNTSSRVVLGKSSFLSFRLHALSALWMFSFSKIRVLPLSSQMPAPFSTKFAFVRSLLSVHSLFETVCGQSSFDELFERIWQRFILSVELQDIDFPFSERNHRCLQRNEKLV